MIPSFEADRFKDRPFLPVLVIGAISLLIFKVSWLGDDAYIAFKASYNLLHGYGPNYNPGHNHILAYGHIAHNVQLGSHITMINVATLGGHVIVEDRAVIGGLAAVHQYCRVGTMSMIGGCSKVVQDIPPYMICDGNPAGSRTINKIGLERNGVSEEAQNALKKAYRILFRSDLGGTNALAKIEKELPQLPELKHLIQFVRASERGISK